MTLDSLTDANGQTYHFSRNALGWLAAQHDLADPSKADSAFYDAAGRQRKLKTRRGDVITLSYDALGRVTGISGPDFPADTFFYDPAGRWVVASNANGRDSSAFDARGRLVSATQRMPDGVTSYQMTYAWDIANRLTSRSAPAGGNPVTLKYNATRGDLDTLCAAGTCVAFRRNSEGLPGTEVFSPNQPGSWTLGRAFSEIHQVTRDSMSIAATDTVFGKRFGYDSLGRVTSVIPRLEDGEWWQTGPRYAYDLAGRLKGACTEAWSRHPVLGWQYSCPDEYGQDGGQMTTSYTYDPAGNRTESVANPLVGAGNRVTRFKGYQIDHDLNGNVWRKAGLGGTDPSDTTLLTWDARNRLVRAEVWPAGGAHTVVTFAYDAVGRRVKKTVNGVTQWFVYDGDHVVLDVDAATGAVQAEMATALALIICSPSRHRRGRELRSSTRKWGRCAASRTRKQERRSNSTRTRHGGRRRRTPASPSGRGWRGASTIRRRGSTTTGRGITTRSSGGSSPRTLSGLRGASICTPTRRTIPSTYGTRAD